MMKRKAYTTHMAKNHKAYTFWPSLTLSTPRHKEQALPYTLSLYPFLPVSFTNSFFHLITFFFHSSFSPPHILAFLLHLQFFYFTSSYFLFSCCHPSVKWPKSYLNTRARLIKHGQTPMHLPLDPEPQCPYARRRLKLRDIANSGIEISRT
jgi:hypothetical protein